MVEPVVNTINEEKILKGIRHMLEAGIGPIEAIIEYSNRNGLEVELVGEVIKRSSVLKYKVQEDAENMNLLEKTNKLPL